MPGVRVQAWLHPGPGLPEVVDLTSVTLNDRQSWDRSVLGDPARPAALAGQTPVVGLGYYRRTAFRDLVAAGVHLVARLYPKTTVAVEDDRPIQPPLPDADGGRIAVVADRRVTRGSPDNHTSAVPPRLKTGHRTPTPRRHEIVTDRWDLAAAEVVRVYLYRRQIELFLRWLEGQLHLPRLLGYSENAVELSVRLAVLVHLLILLAARALGLAGRSPLLLARLAAALRHLDPTRDDAPPTLAQLPLPAFDPHPDAPT